MRRVGAIGGILVCALVSGLPAHAAEPPPLEDVSAIDQYRESIPTASGRKATGSTGAAPLAPLPATVGERVRTQGGNDAELLTKVATSPAYGAPEPQSPRPRERAASSALPEASSSGSGYVPFLVVALAGLAVAGAAFAIARRRRA